VKELPLPYSFQLTSIRDEDMIRQFAALLEEYEEEGDFVLDVDIHTYRDITSDDEPLLPAEKNLRSLFALMNGTQYKFFKSQQTAPATMGFSIRGSDGKRLTNRNMFYFFENLMKRIAQGQHEHLAKSCDNIILCQDDPALGFVKQMIESGQVKDLAFRQIIEMTDSVYPDQVIPAYHYCDDWRLLECKDWYPLWESKPKIVHIDVVRYPPVIESEQAEIMNKFLYRGGAFALGVLPNVDDAYSKPVLTTLEENLNNTLKAFQDSGLDMDVLGANTMISTQCGLSGASAELTREIHSISAGFGNTFLKSLEQIVR